MLRNIVRIPVMFEIRLSTVDFRNKCSVFEVLRSCVFMFSSQKSQNVFHSCYQIYQKSRQFVEKCVTQYKSTETVDDLPEHGKMRASILKEDKAIIRGKILC